MLDSYGRNIRYLRISVTDRCNLRCVYCMPPEGVPNIPHEKILSYERIAQAAECAAKLGFDKFRLTGGEPLVRKDLPHLVSLLARLPGRPSVRMTTNGTLLAPVARELKRRGLESVNISLDTLDPGRYREITRGGSLSDALAGISEAQAACLPVKLNVVMVDEQSETELQAIRRYAEEIGAQVQTIARYSLNEQKEDGGEYDRPPPCAKCDRMRLLADGMLRPCLHGSACYPLDPAHPERSIADAIRAKPLYGAACAEAEAVSAIGG